MGYGQPAVHPTEGDDGSEAGAFQGSDSPVFPEFVAHLADYASGLSGEGRSSIRESLDEQWRTTFDSFLIIADHKEAKEGGKKLEYYTGESYLKLKANEGAKLRKAQEDAVERGHVTTRILTYQQLKNLPRPEPLIYNLAYTGAVGIVLGDSQTGKTWVMLSIAAAAASGMHWPVATGYTPPAPMPVLYVAAEDGGSIGARLECWERAHGKDLNGTAFHFHPSAIDVLDPVQIDELCEAITQEQYRFVVVDTVAASLGGQEEGNAEFSLMVRHMRKLVAAMEGKGSVFLVHHFGKDKTKGARGGSSLFNDADIVWELDGTLDAMRMTCTKWKSDSLRPAWFLRLNREVPNEVHIVSCDAPASGSVGVLTDKAAVLAEAVLKVVAKFATENQGYGPSRNTIAGALREQHVQFRNDELSSSLSVMVSDHRLYARNGPRNATFYRLPPVQEEINN